MVNYPWETPKTNCENLGFCPNQFILPPCFWNTITWFLMFVLRFGLFWALNFFMTNSKKYWEFLCKNAKLWDPCEWGTLWCKSPIWIRNTWPYQIKRESWISREAPARGYGSILPNTLAEYMIYYIILYKSKRDSLAQKATMN